MVKWLEGFPSNHLTIYHFNPQVVYVWLIPRKLLVINE